jgi:tetratricopeptide (TPR) repeat protein
VTSRAKTSAAPGAALERALARLPEIGEVDFDFKVRELLERRKWDQAELKAMSMDGSAVKAKAYATLLTLHWRNLDYRDYRSEVNCPPPELNGSGWYLAQQAIAASTTNDPTTWQEGLRKADEALGKLGEQPPVLHTKASLVALLGERGSAPQQLLDQGLKTVQRAITLREETDKPYAKYHATKARLLACRGEWAAAIEAIDLAIALEPSSGAQYAVHIGDYQNVRQEIILRKHASELVKKQDEAREKLVDEVNATRDGLVREISEMRTQLLQLLGVLAAVVAFITTGVQVATHLRLEAAVALMGAIASGIILAFAGFSLLFLPHQKPRRAVLLMVFGVVAIAGIWSLSKWA